MSEYYVPDRLSEEEAKNVNLDWEEYSAIKDIDPVMAYDYLISMNDESFCCIFSRVKKESLDAEDFSKRINLERDKGADSEFVKRVLKVFKAGLLIAFGDNS